MLRSDWHKHIQFTGWKSPKDDKQVLVAQAFITLRNRRPFKSTISQTFEQNVVVPADAEDEQKEAALERGKQQLIDNFDRLYLNQDILQLSDKTKPLESG